MKIGNPFRAELSGVSNWINEALDSLAARINAIFTVEHNDDGTHADITAESITVQPNTNPNAVDAQRSGGLAFDVTPGALGVFAVESATQRALYLQDQWPNATSRSLAIVLYVAHGASAEHAAQFSLEADSSVSNAFLQVDGLVRITAAEVQVVGAPLCVTDGITAPSSNGMAQIYVDTADGDLKVMFGDGTVKLIVAD